MYKKINTNKIIMTIIFLEKRELLLFLDLSLASLHELDLS